MASFNPHFQLANLMGEHHVTWDVSTVAELLKQGEQEYGAAFVKELKSATVLVNGRAITYLNGWNTPLSDEDEVWTILPSAGG